MRIYIRQVRGRGKKADEVWKAIKREVGAVIDAKVKPMMIKEFEKVTVGWDHKIQFAARKTITKKDVKIHVFPTGANKKIWELVSITGRKPGIIRARRAKALAFQWGGPGSYIPHTVPRGIYGGPGIVTGGKMVFRKSVRHPGFPPRHFEKYIASKLKPDITREIENAMRRATR